jgi:N4-gp56 family major capsid protein
MAVFRAADGTAQTPTLWAADLYAQAESQVWWTMWTGSEGSSMPIIAKTDLTKEPGDTIKMDIVLALTGAGTTGDIQTLEGNEEKVKFRQMSVVVAKKGHAVRWSWLSEVLITHNHRVTARNQLAKWLAGKIDNAIFNEMSGNGSGTIPTSGKWFAGSATSRATVADGNTTGRLTLTTITELKAYAQTELKIEPIKLEGGEEVFGLCCHPYTIMQLKEFDTSWAQAQRDARERGTGNPVFTGAAGMWDGVILYSSQRVPRSTNGTIQVSDNIFFGAQAASHGWAAYPRWVEEEFSYGEERGIATMWVDGVAVNAFDLTDAGGAAAAAYTAIGSVVVYASAVAPTQ